MITEIILFTILVLGILFMACSFFYNRFGMFKWLYHDKLGWHEPDENKGYSQQGINTHATCKYCGEDIIQDSQGNWF